MNYVNAQCARHKKSIKITTQSEGNYHVVTIMPFCDVCKNVINHNT